MAKRGRPSAEPTHEERGKVAELVASKAPIADIAKLLGRSIPTVRKYFRNELISEKKGALPDGIKVTPMLRAKVSRYIGCRMSPEQVAKALDLTIEQLEAHFPDEIATGQAKTRAKVIDELFSQMEDGTVGATKALDAITAIPDGAAPPAAGQVGKKVAAVHTAHAAAAAGGRFAPPAPPKLVVNNAK